ncbi:WW domain-containing protein C2F3.14c [Colletotrichum chlorophyti]|uniref:WW domain-containing protein C2F3.14c n=1 Tax=Colletotrichum chlorophyti TaxID=708187 RepID=A0A1Q8RH76_9PEZI|nr:WW domain-containing protein C2F3.14c [Colletotrichum chlorophyti]
MASDPPRPTSSHEAAGPEESKAADASANNNPTIDKPTEQDSVSQTDETSKRDSSSPESGEASSTASPEAAHRSKENTAPSADAPPLPDDAPPLPSEQPPATEDDGWDFQWDPTSQAYFFYNRFTGASQWENPRVPSAATSSASAAPGTTPAATATSSGPPPLPTNEQPVAGGYNPAIHGDYDPNAWYAKENNAGADDQSQSSSAALVEQGYGAIAQFNRFTGQFQTLEEGPDRHSDEAKSRRQMNAFFDVDAAANAHNGRSLKAERSGKKPTKSELKQFKEKRKARKEEKRRAWLRD